MNRQQLLRREQELLTALRRECPELMDELDIVRRRLSSDESGPYAGIPLLIDAVRVYLQDHEPPTRGELVAALEAGGFVGRSGERKPHKTRNGLIWHIEAGNVVERNGKLYLPK